MSHDELVRAARELIDAASEPIKYPANSEHDEVVLVPANLLWLLREALDPRYDTAPTSSQQQREDQ